MLVCRAAGFIYRDECSELAKSLFKSVNRFDAFDLQGDYRIGEAFLGGCWLFPALWDKSTRMRKAMINNLDIIIYLDYLNRMEMHRNVW